MDGLKEYLGDSVYVDHNGHKVVLTTEQGGDVTNRIYLSPEVVQALASYIRRVVTRGQHERV